MMKNNQMNGSQDSERGFILVTSLVLLAILTMLGAVSFFKTNIETKVSAGSVQAEQAYSAMRAGTHKIYAHWNGAGSGEFDALGAWVGSRTGSSPTIYVNNYPDEISDLLASGVVSPPTGARVYTFTPVGAMSTGTNWNVGNDPQVAIWVTSYQPQTGATYPYASPNHVTTTACGDCALVLYSLGRSGDSMRLAREYMSTVEQNLQTYGAMTNAPKQNNMCQASTDPASTTSTTTSNLTTTIQNSHLIDATQSPGGVAVASNNGIDWASGNKQWKNGSPYNGGTGSSAKGIDPYVIYDPGKVEKSSYPQVSGGQVSAIAATVVSDNRFADGYMDYFQDVNSQLFQLDAYREAANRIAGFYTETLGNGDTIVTGVGGTASTTTTLGTPLGNYNVLKNGGTVDGVTYPNNGFARMGTIQWADLRYNIDNSIPMYGLMRFLLPARRDGTNTVTMCTGQPAIDKYKIIKNNDDAVYGIDPIATANGKLIVYGGALFDFYNDANNNNIYEPDTEVLITPEEALTFKINVDSPLMFNPVMDLTDGSTFSTSTGVGPRTGATDATVSTDYTQIDEYPNGSPSWDLVSDTLPGGDGAMDLIEDAMIVARAWNARVYDQVNSEFASGTGAFDDAGVDSATAGTATMMLATNAPLLAARATSASAEFNAAEVAVANGAAGAAARLTAAIAEVAAVAIAADALATTATTVAATTLGDSPGESAALDAKATILAVAATAARATVDAGTAVGLIAPLANLAAPASALAAVTSPIADAATLATPGSYKNWMNGAAVTFGSTSWGTVDANAENNMHTLLNYYIRSTAQASKAAWSHNTVDDIEKNFTKFRIETETDLNKTSPSAADLYHSFLPSGYIHGWKRALLVTGLAKESSVTGVSKWNQDLIGSGSTFSATKSTYFNITGVGNSAKIDKDFADIPAEMYAGGLVDMHQIVNTSGVVYTPGQLELEQKNKNGYEALQYINGIVITGHGTFMKQETSNARTVIMYDATSTDNLPTQTATIVTGRKFWQELK